MKRNISYLKVVINGYSNKKGGDTMPGRDTTGPEGGGSRTGRGLGPCAPGNKNSEPVNNPAPRPRRDGSGGGMGRRNRGQ